jgi:hypothetical protein
MDGKGSWRDNVFARGRRKGVASIITVHLGPVRLNGKTCLSVLFTEICDAECNLLSEQPEEHLDRLSPCWRNDVAQLRLDGSQQETCR